MRPAPLLILLLALVVGLVAYFATGGFGDREGLEGPNEVEDGGGPGGELSGLSPSQIHDGGSNRESVGEGEPETAEVEREVLVEAPSNAQNELRGSVVDVDGVPLEGCRVTFLASGSGALSWETGARGEEIERPWTLTDTRGEFQFLGLEPSERHGLMVHHPDVALLKVENVFVAEYGLSVEPPIVLRPGRRLRGRVLDDANLPVVGAQLHLDSRWRHEDPKASLDRMSTETDGEGKYVLTGIPDGQRFLTVEMPGYGTQTRTQSLIFSEVTGVAHVVDFVLQPKVKLAGRVVNSDGEPLAGVDLVAADRSPSIVMPNTRCLSDAEGRFEMPAAQATNYQILFRAEGYQPGVANEVAAPAEELELVLEAQTLFRGIVLEKANGQPLRDFSLRLRYSGSPGAPSTPAGPMQKFQDAADGAFALAVPQPRGRFVVEAQAEGFAPGRSAPFDNRSGNPKDGIRIELSRGGTITGRLIDTEGRALSGARIESRDSAWSEDPLFTGLGDYFPTDATHREEVSDGQGRFRLANLGPGIYQVIADTSRHHRTSVGGIRVEEGGEVDLGDVLLAEGGSLRGVLYDSAGTALQGGILSLEPVDVDALLPSRTVKSGVEGAWRLRNLVPGEYFLVAQPPPNLVEGILALPESDDQLQRVTVSAGTEDVRDVHLIDWVIPKPEPPAPPTGQLSGHITNADGSAPSSLQLSLEPTDPATGPGHLAKTEREGAYTILAVLPGEYEFLVVGHEETRVTVIIEADNWTYQDLQLGE